MRTTGQRVPAGVPPLAPGDPSEAGGCVLLGRLGLGGMGTVYLGRAADGTLAAVKTLLPARRGDPEAHRRFRAEAAYAQRVASFCTARVLADGSHLTHPYIVTEYIDGPPLAQVVERRGALPQDGAVAVGIGVAVALAAIHGAGLVHRDLKPANVLLSRTGPRVIDFGIAVDPGLADGPTQAGSVMGSPGWIAPERLTGGAAAPAADVFGWGCLVAYAATGRHPFGTGEPDRVGERILHDPPDLAGLDEPLLAPVLAALGKNPALRPSPAELLHTLLPLRAAGDPVKAIAGLWEPTEFGATPPPARRRLLVRAGFAAAWATAGAGAAVWAVTGADPSAEARPEPGRTEVVTVQPGKAGTGGGAPGPADRGVPAPGARPVSTSAAPRPTVTAGAGSTTPAPRTGTASGAPDPERTTATPAQPTPIKTRKPPKKGPKDRGVQIEERPVPEPGPS